MKYFTAHSQRTPWPTDPETAKQQKPRSRSAPRETQSHDARTSTRFNRPTNRRTANGSPPLGLPIRRVNTPGSKRLQRCGSWQNTTAFRWALIVIIAAMAAPNIVKAHEGHTHAPTPTTKTKIIRLNTEQPKHHVVVFKNTANQEITNLFAPFKKTVSVRFDNNYMYVESNGMPAHSMMTGITAWQQQVPLPQSYTGSNAWRIPLHPVPSTHPTSTKTNFFRGAIALAVNGVPIFNPIKNDGRTDTLQAGELDQWGGHCGRADDYHYHIAPVHLEKIVGAGNPVAVALDGYPIYGYNDPNGKPPTDLDQLNGHIGPHGNYHYHATKTFPYLNGGFYGEVTERNGQVHPQPRAQPMRPSLPPLRGAKITGFDNPKPNNYVVSYDVNGDQRSIDYTIANNGSATFNFVSPQRTTTQTYTQPQRGGPRNEGRGDEPPAAREQRQPRANKPNMERGQQDQARRTQRGAEQGQDRGVQQQRGGSDSIFQAIDSNGNGILEKAEIQDTAKAILSLDKNNDGKITREELRSRGGGRGQQGRPQNDRRQNDRRQDARQPNDRPPKDGRQQAARRDTNRRANGAVDQANAPRQPWIIVHADEIDLDKNKIISRDEIVAEAIKAFDRYDANNDGQLSASELGAGDRSLSAMGGFLKRHSKEIDRDADGIMTRAEAVSNSERMFANMDTNQDNQISGPEMEAASRS